VKSDADKRKYLRDIRDKEDIELDPDKIVKNPGRRALAKLMLVSFWGKVHTYLHLL